MFMHMCSYTTGSESLVSLQPIFTSDLSFTFYVYPCVHESCCQKSLPSSVWARPDHHYQQHGLGGTILNREPGATKKSGIENRFAPCSSMLSVK